MGTGDVVQLLGLAFVGAGFFLAAWTFRKNTRIRRAEWLASLYDKFYENRNLKDTRALLDYPSAERDELFRCLASDPDNARALEPLVDYLNFFEFVASLWQLGQLKTEEVEMMFEYYLRDLAKKPEVMGFIEKEGFERLQALIARMTSS
jgi:hypothetical protein